MDTSGAYTSHRGEYPGGKPLSTLCLAMTQECARRRLKFASLLIDALAAAFETTGLDPITSALPHCGRSRQPCRKIASKVIVTAASTLLFSDSF